MPKDNENIRLPLLGPVEPSEPHGFTAEQMIRCDECLRANPPTRINCLYCSVPLPMTEASARLRKPILRKPEKHQLGYNTILLPKEQTFSAEAIAEAAALVLVCVTIGRLMWKRSLRKATAMFAPASDVTGMKHAIDAIAVEVERISENQRYATKLLQERAESIPRFDAGAMAPVEQRRDR